MKNKSKYLLLFISLALVTTIFLLPEFLQSTSLFFNLRRVTVKVGARFSEWKNKQTKTISLVGRLRGNGAMVEALKGAQVIAIESTSGYTALTDQEGKFTIPHLTWYPGAEYNLVVSPSTFYNRLIKVKSPEILSETFVLDLGDLDFSLADEVERSELIFRTMPYDSLNHNYYKALFDELTLGISSDEEKISKVNKYVATKLNYNEPAKNFPSPKAVIESGSCYCSNLAIAMAALTAAGNYPTRTVHLSDTPEYNNTHVVVEVYYKDQWHLYDPTYGIFFLNDLGVVASYKDLRLNSLLVKSEAFQGFDPKLSEDVLKWMPGAFNSGFHQIYFVKKNK